MNILLLGSGGREHALAWKMAASPLTDRLYCAPGNAGIAQEAECIALDLADHAGIVAFCRNNKIDLVVVGPEAPLCAGIVDNLEAAGIKAFGPSRAASSSPSFLRPGVVMLSARFAPSRSISSGALTKLPNPNTTRDGDA